MFFSVYNNQSGEEHIRRLGPNETLDIRHLVQKWAKREYSEHDIKLSFSEPGYHIHNGCADWQAEIRLTKQGTGSCWQSEPFYLHLGESE